MKSFDRVYQRYVGDGLEGPSVRIKVVRLSDGSWLYELPGKFAHPCEEAECPDLDRMAMLFLPE